MKKLILLLFLIASISSFAQRASVITGGSGGGSMVYPSGTGIPTVSAGSSWSTTIPYFSGSNISYFNNGTNATSTSFWRGDGTWATPAGTGTVTSVGLTVPTGFSVSNSPVTSAGNIGLGFAVGYSLPSDNIQLGWTNSNISSVSVTGTTTKTLTLTKTGGGTVSTTFTDETSTGGGDGYISSVTASNNDLVFTGTGGAFSGTLNNFAKLNIQNNFTAYNTFSTSRAGSAVTVSNSNGLGSGLAAGGTLADFHGNTSGILWLVERANSPSTQSSGQIYPMADGKLYYKNPGGTEYDLTSTGGSGNTTLTFSGNSSAVTLMSDTGGDVVFNAGTNVSFSSISSGAITINSTGGGGMVYPSAGIAISTGSSWSTSASSSTAGQLLRRNASNTGYEFWTPTYISSYTETDPVWSGVSSNYYTKTNLQTNGQSFVDWGNIINNPDFITGNQLISLSGHITGSGSTSISTTIANNVITPSMLATYGGSTPYSGAYLGYGAFGMDWFPAHTGSGTSGQVSYWVGTYAQSGESSFTYSAGTNTLYADYVTVANDAYGAGWNGSSAVPTKDAVYDKIQTLSVAGSNTQVQYNNSGSFGASSSFTFNSGTGVVTATNFQLGSDKKLKTKIRPLQDLVWVDDIEFVSFKMKSDKKTERYGVIAQQVEKVNSDLVYTNENTGMKAVSYIDLLVAKVARQDQQIKDLTERIEKLEKLLTK